MLGVFACKRAAASLGGENPTGTRRRRHDYRSLPSSDGRCQSFRSGDENEGDAGGRRREERDPDSGGIRKESGRKVEGGSWAAARGTEGESMTYAEAGSARDFAQFPASLANGIPSEGRRAVENSLDKGFALSPPSFHLHSFFSPPRDR